MRKELEEFQWHVYGLSKDDLSYVVRVTQEIIDDRKTVLEKEIEKIKQENPEDADDILDDYVYYKNLECFYLWEFLIIRLIGVFEGVMEQNFLPQGKYRGYQHRLETLVKNGYKIENIDELGKWVNLRNALSHMPPEQHRPILIDKDDIADLEKLLIAEIENLESQKASKT
ncbi:MAG: hypothetical protein R3D71_11345 [Rickettsiales bacterium]